MATLKSTLSSIREDGLRLNKMAGPGNGLGFWRWVSLVFRPELFTTILYRFSHYLYWNSWPRLATVLYRMNLLITGADITPDSRIGPGCLIVHSLGMVIDADIGSNATLFGHTIIEPRYEGGRWSRRPRLGDRVTVGVLGTILGDVSLADGTVIAPYSLVETSVEAPGEVVSVIPGEQDLVSKRTKWTLVEEGDELIPM